MSNEERFWESAIAEAVRDDAPPDVAPRVLAELADDAGRERTRTDDRSRGRVIRALARYGLEIGTAAAVVLAIAWATGLLHFGGPEEVTAPKDYAAAPGTVVNENKDSIELQRGWLLVTTGAPEVRRGDSKLTEVDGRVLLHAGKAPTREQVTAVREWLNANKLEEDMIANPKRWIAGAALAALVLSGSANLDGERIEAQDEEQSTEVVWHKVRSVMDIDNLPEDVEYVNADGSGDQYDDDWPNAALLDFLAEVQSLKGISIRWAVGLRPDHLESLKALPKLEWLDLRGTRWIETEDFAAHASGEELLELEALKYVGFDLMPANTRRSRSKSEVNEFDYRSTSLPTLERLSSKNVEISLGRWSPDGQKELRDVFDKLPTLRGADIYNPSTGEMKMLSQHEGLRRLRLRSYSIGEIGLAYLARYSAVETLEIEANLELPEVHQIARMKLRSLSIFGELSGSPSECFGLLAKMGGLRELELNHVEVTTHGARAFAQFQENAPLDELKVNDATKWRPLNWLLAHKVPATRLEMYSYYMPLLPVAEVPEWVLEESVGQHLRELRFNFGNAEFSRDEYGDDEIATLLTYTGLERVEIQRGGFEEPAMQDEFVRWLKEGLPDVEVVVVP